VPPAQIDHADTRPRPLRDPSGTPPGPVDPSISPTHAPEPRQRTPPEQRLDSPWLKNGRLRPRWGRFRVENHHPPPPDRVGERWIRTDLQRFYKFALASLGGKTALPESL